MAKPEFVNITISDTPPTVVPTFFTSTVQFLPVAPPNARHSGGRSQVLPIVHLIAGAGTVTALHIQASADFVAHAIPLYATKNSTSPEILDAKPKELGPWEELADQGMWTWEEHGLVVFLSRNKNGRWIVPRCALSMEQLRRLVPKLIAKLPHREYQPDKNEVTDVSETLPLIPTDEVDNSGATDPFKLNAVPQPIGLISLVSCDKYAIWWVGHDQTNFVAQVWVNVRGVADRDCEPAQYLPDGLDRQHTAPPGFLAVPRLPADAFPSKLLVQVIANELEAGTARARTRGPPATAPTLQEAEKAARKIVPPEHCNDPFLEEYRRRDYFVHLLRPPANTAEACTRPPGARRWDVVLRVISEPNPNMQNTCPTVVSSGCSERQSSYRLTDLPKCQRVGPDWRRCII
jgi:hypothetical protein